MWDGIKKTSACFHSCFSIFFDLKLSHVYASNHTKNTIYEIIETPILILQSAATVLYIYIYIYAVGLAVVQVLHE